MTAETVTIAVGSTLKDAEKAVIEATLQQTYARRATLYSQAAEVSG